MHLWYDGKLWSWEIIDADGDHLTGESVKTEGEAWTGMRQGMDKYTRKAAEAYFKNS